MRIVREAGLAGAERSAGLVVVIDVFRAFTVSAYALAAGARECILVREVDEALRVAAGIPGSLVSAEVDGLPVPGIPISNSPTAITGTALDGRTLVQRTSAGTQCVAAAHAAGAERVLGASLVVAEATARRVRALGPRLVTLVASGEPEGHEEDHVCADYLTGLLGGAPPDPASVRRRVEACGRYRALLRDPIPGFPPTDLELAADVDRFDFAMEVDGGDGLLRLRRVRAGGGSSRVAST